MNVVRVVLVHRLDPAVHKVIVIEREWALVDDAEADCPGACSRDDAG